ncbi:MAG: DUF1449 family protein [bacterium]|nr:DUF1449 family protein [bacterium]
MLETLKIAITGINLLPTILLVLVLIYWLIMILGLIDMDHFHIGDADVDVDLDVDADAHADVHGDLHGDMDAGASVHGHPGFFHSTLIFLNFAHVPSMIIISILVLLMWTFMMLANVFPIVVGGWIAGLLLIPGLLLSAVFTKWITTPLVKLFKRVEANIDEGADTIGRVCILLKDLQPGRLGQAELKADGKHLVINVKTTKESGFLKGESALIVDKDKKKNFFNIVEFNE